MVTIQDLRSINENIHLISTPISDQPDFFFEIEAKYYQNVSLKRKREFITGRICARKALAHFGVPPCPIPIGTNREPIWPSGFVGSITHCKGFIAAAVAKASEYLSIGIDAEPNNCLPAEIEAAVLTVADKKFIQEHPTEKDIPLLIFSAKESVYKCTFPLVKQYIDFLEVDIQIEISEKIFSTRHSSYIIEKIGQKTLQGVYWKDETHLFTAAFIKK